MRCNFKPQCRSNRVVTCTEPVRLYTLCPGAVDGVE